MHKSAIHPEVVRRVNERRGGLRVFDSIVCKRTAHIIVDLQNGFMAPGQVAEIATVPFESTMLLVGGSGFRR